MQMQQLMIQEMQQPDPPRSDKKSRLLWYQKKLWFMFLSPDLSEIEFMVLINRDLYEDSSGFCQVPLLGNMVFEGPHYHDDATVPAGEAIKKYLFQHYGRTYNGPRQNWVTCAPHTEETSIRQDVKRWFDI